MQLAAWLRAAGRDALWLPAFDVLPSDAPQQLADALRGVERFDLVVMVSAEAARALGRAWKGARDSAWPASTTIAAMGSGTREAILSCIPGAALAPMLCPQGEASDGGSEALWKLLEGRSLRPRHALIVRAQTGREWLLERLRESGTIVTGLAAYRRQAHRPGPTQMAALRAACAARLRPVILFSSSEAVALFAGQFDADAPLAAWLAKSIVLCVHPRIVQAAVAAGWHDARLNGGSADAIMQSLDSNATPDTRESTHARA